MMSAPSNTEDDIKSIVHELSSAIQAGNTDLAVKLVSELSQQRLKINISVPDVDQTQQTKENGFSLKVRFEDRLSDGGNFELMVKASDTIADLKKKVMLKYNFPMEVQRWIIGKKIYEDKDRLRSCGIKGPGQTVYLYLVTARSVGLNQNAYQQQRAMLLMGANRDQWPLQFHPNGGSTSNKTVGLTVNISGNDHSDQQLWRQSSSVSHASDGSLRLQEMLNSPNLSAPISNSPNLQNVTNSPAVDGRGGTAAAFPLYQDCNNGLYQEEEFPPDSTSPAYVLNSRPTSTSDALPQVEEVEERWECPTCTLLNLPTRPGCEACSAPRPADYKVPHNYVMTPQEISLLNLEQQQERLARESAEQEAIENFQRLVTTYDLDLVPNMEPFQCPICFDDIEPGEGIVLRDCLHTFCGDCLRGAIGHCDDAVLKCPYQDDNYSCPAELQEREVKALVSPETYQKYLQRGLDQAESQTANSYHCKTSDCRGWCIYEDLVNFFTCEVCRKENCLTCKAIHMGKNCKEYQDGLNERAKLDKEAQQTRDMLQKLVADGEAMHCPRCQVIVQKKGGCDWIKCSICKLEICWVTKGPRWGPKGDGDTSGGCKCRVGGRKCHPDCINCH